MFVACGIWCLADVSSVSPSSEQTAGSSGARRVIRKLLEFADAILTWFHFFSHIAG